mmetsp:Transcript_20977/g.47297  ORF Transcript_20977/g.47297 Transcript_20977/m.47297 type:complete len:456 (-) Transcript_20977:37-1404(-)
MTSELCSPGFALTSIAAIAALIFSCFPLEPDEFLFPLNEELSLRSILKDHVRTVPTDAYNFFDSEILLSDLDLTTLTRRRSNSLSDDSAEYHHKSVGDAPSKQVQQRGSAPVCKHSRYVGVNISLVPGIGWGHLGLALFLELLNDSEHHDDLGAPLLFGDVHPMALSPGFPHHKTVNEALNRQEPVMRRILSQLQADIPMIHAVDHMHFDRPRLMGKPNLAIIFFDSVVFTPALISAAEKNFDGIIVGSTWNAQVLRGIGVKIPVHLVLQGVDTNVFHPASKEGGLKGGRNNEEGQQRGQNIFLQSARPRKLRDRFVVFSGGKFELRKAQDIVAASFRSLLAEGLTPRPILVFAWHNPWPIRWYAEKGGPGYTTGVPTQQADGSYDFTEWLSRNGVSSSDSFDLGHRSSDELSNILRNWVDVALFPNRCEGGTNLVAMEAMASGVPVILSANTGE